MQSKFMKLRMILLGVLGLASVASAEDSFPVAIHVDAAKTQGEIKPIWRFFGADEPNYATMKNGEKLIGELGALSPGNVYFRAHNLLTSGDGTPAPKWGSTGAYSEDTNGNPVYNWKIVDGIFDTYLKHGVRPYAQIGFMPKEMSIHPEPYQHNWKPGDDYGKIYTGWTFPPKDFDKWRELVFQWVKHCVDKYGRAEVEKWYWEVWNEPDIGYWRGQPRIPTFLKLHDYAIDGVRRALPTARVGGPELAGGGGDFMRQFLEHCLRGTNYATGQVGTPIDFMSFHAKGGTTYTNDHVRMSAGNHLRIASGVYRLISQFPELKSKPIVIGESDPDGCAACDAEVYPANRYRNRAQFASYSAAVFARQTDVAERSGVNLEGALTWSFEFEGQPAFDGFRTLASDGIDKPVMSAFRIMSQLTGKKVAAESDHGIDLDEMMRRGVRTNADVSARASLDGNKLCVMVWHYHDEDVPGAEAAVEVALDNLPPATGQARLEHYQVDEEHSNAVTAWQKMGSPKELTPEQYAQLEKAGQLALLDGPKTVDVKDGKATVKFNLPRQGVALLKLTW
jgi:xylan 1,4-beta-xylosidase